MSSVPSKPKPGGLAFLFPILLWVVTTVVAVVLLVGGFSRYSSIIDDFERVSVGEPQTVALEAGDHTIWLERPGIDDTVIGASLTATITAPDGTEVPTRIYSSRVTYSQGSRDGRAMLTFDAPVDGDYTIVGSSSLGGTMAIGTENPVSAIGVGVGLFFAVGIAGFLVALIILIVLLVKRSGSKKRIRAATAAAYGPPGCYGGPGGYGAPGYQPPSPGGHPPPAPQGFGTPPPPPPPPGGGWGGPPPPT